MPPTRRGKASAATTASAVGAAVAAPRRSARTAVTSKQSAVSSTAATKAGDAKASSTASTDAAITSSKSAKAPTKAAMKATKSTAAKPAATMAPKNGRTAKVVDDADLVVLDHKSYPHIFEAIFENSPYNSLLVLRATCKSMLDRVDAKLSEHVVIRAGLPPPKGAKWERMRGFLPRGPEKQRPRQTRINVAALGGQLPGFVCDYNHTATSYDEDSCGAKCDKLRARWEKHFENTRVIDIHPWMAGLNRFHHASKPFKNVEITRYYPYDMIKCDMLRPRMVVFTDFECITNRKAWTNVTSAPCCFIDEVVDHLVVHASYNVERPTLPNCWVQMPSRYRKCMESVVLIVEPTNGDDINPDWPTKDLRPNGMLWDVANQMRVGVTTQFTLVGVTELPLPCLGISDLRERTKKELEAEIMDNVIEWIRDDHMFGGDKLKPERVAEIRSLISFATREEYRVRVGEKQWAIEAIPTKQWE